MNGLVIAHRAIPVPKNPQKEYRLAVDTAAAILYVVLVEPGKVTLVDHLSDAMCKKRGVLPPPPEALRGDPRRLLTSIPDGDYARLLSDYHGDIVDRIVNIRTSAPAADYELYTFVVKTEADRCAPVKDNVSLNLEERLPDEPDQPHPFRSYRQSEVAVRLAAAEYRSLCKQAKLRGTQRTHEARVRDALRAMKRAAEMLGDTYFTVYLGTSPVAIEPAKV